LTFDDLEIAYLIIQLAFPVSLRCFQLNNECGRYARRNIIIIIIISSSSSSSGGDVVIEIAM